MQIRTYRPVDCPALARLFYDAVHSVCAKDYTAAQRRAWADGAVDIDAWNRSFLAHDTLVALDGDIITGFGDMTDTGYLDRLYVHKGHQRLGIATALCDRLEERAAAARIVVHASITARPFFENRGYRVLRTQQVERKGILLTNFVMEKQRGQNG